MSVYVTPFSPDQETKGTPTLINLLVDGSGSMDPIKPELVASINQDFLGALQAINDTEKKTVRVHAEVFGTEIFPLITGFRAPWQLRANEVIEAQLQLGELGNTALYKCIKTGFGHLIQASTDLGQSMNKNTKAKLIVLTDGANNQPPYNEDGTSQVYRTFNHPQDWVTTEKILVYFRTDLVVSEEQFVEIADACGFNELIIFDQHKTNREALRKEIRRVIHLLSNRRAFGHQSMPDGILTHTFEPCTSW